MTPIEVVEKLKFCTFVIMQLITLTMLKNSDFSECIMLSRDG